MSEKSIFSKRKIAIILNIIILILEIIAIPLCFQHGGFKNIKYYTVLSNFFTMITCICYIVYSVKSKSQEMPYWIRIIRYMGSNCLALTFIVVVVVLIPMTKNGVRILLFEGPQLFHHVICPALSVISFGLFEDGKPTHKDALFAALPTLVYAIVTVILNYAKLLDGPYPFLKVYEQSIFASIFWFISIVGISYVLAYLIKLLTKFKGENAKKDDNNTDTNNNTKITEAEEMV